MPDVRLQRRPDIDALRVFATYLLFIFHVAKVFDPAPFFHIRSAETSPVFYILAGFIGQWHMPLFFALAGWSALASIQTRGASGFMNDRVRRLLIPLVAGCLAFGPVLKFYELRSGLDLSHTGLRVSDEIRASLASLTDFNFERLPPFQESFGAFWPSYFTHLSRFTWGHLWFIAYLLTLSTVLVPLLSAMSRARSERALRAVYLYAPLAPLLLIQFTLRGRFPGIYNLYNDWANLFFYAVYFLSGALLAVYSQAEDLVRHEWKRAFVLGTAAMLVLLATALGLIRSPSVILAASTVAGWCYVLALFGGARSLRIVEGPRLRWLAESAFPVYVLHQVVIVVIGFYLLKLPLGIGWKYVLLVAASLAGTLLLYEGLRRLQPARFLLGMKPLACSVRPRVVESTATLLVLFAVGTARADSKLAATLYQIGSQRKVISFRWDLDRGDGSVWKSQYRSIDGVLIAEDRVVWNAGRVARYQYHRPTINERAEVERRDGKILYTQVMDGRTRTGNETDRDNFTVGPTLVPYLQAHWQEVLAGKRLPITYGVPDQLRSYEFEAQREGSPSAGADVVVRFRPANLLYRMFVDYDAELIVHPTEEAP
jgi:peptidoglycan/LPS O-acetylase OafA/YrhL